MIAGKSGDYSGRDYWLRDIIAADRAAGAARTDRSRALAAKATLTLAAPVREEFKRIKLVIPLKKSLAEKRKAMEAALKAYDARPPTTRWRKSRPRRPSRAPSCTASSARI